MHRYTKLAKFNLLYRIYDYNDKKKISFERWFFFYFAAGNIGLWIRCEPIC